MKKRLLCLLLLLSLTACRAAPDKPEEPGFRFYFPEQTISYQDGAIRAQDAGQDAASQTPEEVLTAYLAAEPPEGTLPPVPEDWTFQSAALEGATVNLRFTGKDVGALRRSLAAACLAKTLLQLQTVERVSLLAPGLSEPLVLTENDVFLRDTAMLPQEEVLVLYRPDAARRYLERETRLVEVMDEAEKPAYLVRQLLEQDCIPEGTRLLGIQTGNGVCTVDLSSEFENAMEESFAAERMAVYSIVNSLTELPEITSVDLWVAGAPLERLGLLELSAALRRDETLIAAPAGEDQLDVTLYPTCGDSGLLVAIPQRLARDPSRQTAELALYALLAYEGSDGVRSCIPEGTKPLSLRVEDGACAVDLSAEFLDGCANAEEEVMAVRSIVATMCALPEISSVEIFVEGIEPPYRDESLHFLRHAEADWFAP